MRPAGPLPLLSAGLAVLAASPAFAAGLSSPDIAAKIRQGLPTYQPPAPPAEGEVPAAATTRPNPDVLELPKMTIRERKPTRIDPDQMISRRDLNRQLSNRYLDSLAAGGALDTWLNGFTIPLLSPSRADRGRALRLGEELDRLADLMTKQEAKSLNGFYDELAGTLGRRAPKRR